MSSSNLNDHEPVYGHVPSPAFEDIRKDLQAFLANTNESDTDMPNTTNDMEVDPAERTKRHLSTTDGDSEGRPPQSKNAKTNNKRNRTSSLTRIAQKSTTEPSATNAKKMTEIHKDSKKNDYLVELPSKYGAFTKAPYIVHFRLPSTKEKLTKKSSLLSVSKKLNAANVKFLDLRRYSRDTWKANFPSKAAANTVLNNKYVKEAGFSVFIPGHKLSRRFIIRDIPLDFSLEEIKTAIEEENNEILVAKIFRLKRRDRTTGLWVESETVCVQKLGEDLPENIRILKTINPTSPYIASVRLCFKCGFYGHLSKFCEREQKCLQCGGTHQNTKEAPCQLEKKCINCNETHATTDRKCPFYIRNAEIAKVMAFDNMPFFEAKAFVIKQEKGASSPLPPPIKTTKNFPSLPQKGGVSLVDSPTAFHSSHREKPWTHLFKDCGDEVKSRTYRLIDKMLDAENIDILLDRLEKTVSLHGEIQKTSII